jgi:hypothetical protein
MPLTVANAPAFIAPAILFALSILGVLSIANILFGTTVRSWVTQAELRIAKAAEGILWRILGKRWIL